MWKVVSRTTARACGGSPRTLGRVDPPRPPPLGGRIRHLHEKLDHLLSHQWERLVEIQQVQMQLLAELQRR
jgi:hypothetical protein